MDNDRRSLLPLSNLGTPTLVLIAGAVFAGALFVPSYDSSRPKPHVLALDPAADIARAPALATQDPLEIAYARATELKLLAPDSRLPTTATLTSELGRDASVKTLVLVVSMHTGAWPEDRERRVRTRYAVSTALAQEHFHARSPREIRFVKADFEGAAIVPYDQYDADDGASGKFGHVLCLWLDEVLLSDKPFQRTCKFLDDVIGAHTPNVSARFLGPSGSGVLHALMSDAAACESDAAFPRPAWGPLTVVSTMATVPFDPDPPLDDKVLPETLLVRRFEADARLLKLVRTIGQDDELARMLLLELTERIPSLMHIAGEDVAWNETAKERFKSQGVEPPQTIPASRVTETWPMLGGLAAVLKKVRFIPPRMLPVRVALVSESDTEYGRRWMANFNLARDQLAAERPLLNAIEFEFVPFTSVIDGSGLVGQEEARKGGEVAADDVGASQVDYLRRMQRMLGQGRPVAAIGVLGTDVYDRLMILQALRPKFPNAVFFATDLDSRLLERQHLPYTRNVVVASHFDLGGTNEPLQFRDSYQYATYRALDELLQRDDVTTMSWKHKAFSARLFELGRGVAVELNTRSMPLVRSSSPAHAPDFALLQIAHSVTSALFSRDEVRAQGIDGGGIDSDPAPTPSWKNLWLGASLVILMAIVAVLARTPAGSSQRSPRNLIARALAFLTVPAIALIGVMSCIELLDEASHLFPAEPFDPFVGVSVWPTILLRAVCSVFCLWSIVMLRSKLKNAEARARRDYTLFAGDTRTSLASIACWLFGISVEGERVLLDADAVWSGVRRWITSWWWLVLRLCFYVAFCHFLSAPFFMRTATSAPVRGEFAFVIERFSIVVNVWTFFALICFVLETSFLALRLVQRLADSNTVVFPSAFLAQESKRLGITPKQAEQRGQIMLTRLVTQVSDEMVYYPAIAVGLMILARASTIDNWSWPVVLVGTLTMFFALLILSVLNSNRVARAERAKVLDFLRQERFLASGDAVAKDRLELLRNEIENLRGGAFSPLIDHPIVRSAALPLAAWASAGLLDQGTLGSLLQKL